MRRWLPLMAPVLLAGCVLGPDHVRPEVALPEALPLPASTETPTPAEWAQWWRRFDDPVLDALIARASRDNLDLQQQAAAVRAARARLGFAEAEQLPTVDLQAEASRQRQPAAAYGIPGAESSTRSLFSVSGVLGYELDLWGRLARSREGAAAQLTESVYAREALRLGVIADVATTYFEWRAAQRQLAITEDAIAAREEAVSLQRIRYEAGAVDRLVLLQARSELETTRAQLPDRRQRVRALESALGLLLGWTPAELAAETPMADAPASTASAVEAVPPVLPATLLERRPDIRAAEEAVRAANAAVGQAQAARLPGLNLSGLIGTTAAETGDLFTGAAETWSLGASVLGPVLDFGRGRANVEAARAERDRLALQYRATVNRAFAEVRDALHAFEAARQRVAAVQRQVEAVQETFAVAEIRYDEGATDFLEVLDARRALLDARLALSAAEQQRLATVATLYKALGGGWREAGEAEAAAAATAD